MQVLCDILGLLPKKDYVTIGEVGVHNGMGSTRIFLDYLKFNKGCLICVEWFQGSSGTNIIPGFRGEFNRCVSDVREKIILLPVSSKQASEVFDDGTFDLFFIDADHRYSQVSMDLDYWWPKVKLGGIFCGHDYERRDYDEKHIEEDYVSERHHGVIKAVNEKFFMKHKFAGSCWWVRKSKHGKGVQWDDSKD